jgi:hypothetical protein
MIIFGATGIQLKPLAYWSLLFAGVYNTTGGFAAIVLWPHLAQYMGFLATGPSLFRLFSGVVAIGFGIGYLLSARGYAPAKTFLVFGCSIKLMAFLIGVYAYLFEGLSPIGLILFGFGNLFFAILFILALIKYSSNS